MKHFRDLHMKKRGGKHLQSLDTGSVRPFLFFFPFFFLLFFCITPRFLHTSFLSASIKDYLGHLYGLEDGDFLVFTDDLLGVFCSTLEGDGVNHGEHGASCDSRERVGEAEEGVELEGLGVPVINAGVVVGVE